MQCGRLQQHQIMDIAGARPLPSWLAAEAEELAKMSQPYGGVTFKTTFMNPRLQGDFGLICQQLDRYHLSCYSDKVTTITWAFIASANRLSDLYIEIITIRTGLQKRFHAISHLMPDGNE